MKGFRVPPQATKKEQFRELDTEIKNMQMAARVSQMMTQQLMQSVKSMSEDLGNALNQLYELQYKYTALQKHLNLPVEALNELANQQRLVDFNEAAVKQDLKDNLVEATEVTNDSTITISSVAKDETGNDRGIFRSRLKLSECGVPDLITGLAGKKVGDKVQVKLNGVDHQVELLSARNPAQVEVLPVAAQ
jgi:chromosome segregation ATPase